MIKTKYLAILSAGVLTLGLAGCSTEPNEEPHQTQAPQVTQSEAADNSDDAAVTPQGVEPFANTQAGIDAIKAAEAEADGKAIDLDREDKDKLWEIKVIEGDEVAEYYVYADGKIAENKREKADEEEKAHATEAMPMVDAIKKAMGQVADGYLDEAELDEEDGVIVWQVSFDDAKGNDLKDLELDYQSGDILTLETDN